MLTADNPAAPKKLIRFNMKERTYKLEPMVDNTIVHYATDGWLLNKGSEEAKKQMDMERMEHEASTRFQMEVERSQVDSMRSSHALEGEGGNEGPDDSKQLRNQFNFSERAAQTTYHALRDRETYTEPPPKANVSGSCSQWEIYDEYNDEDYDETKWSNFQNIDLGIRNPYLTNLGSFYLRAFHLRHSQQVAFRLQAIDLELALGSA